VRGPTPADLIDEEEVTQLSTTYGPAQRRQVTLEVAAQTIDEWWKRMVVKANRRGEVVLAARRRDGQILLHTKRFYPQGIYRLPSGGVHPQEAVLAAVIREAHEETGLDVTLERFLATVEYEFYHEQRRVAFVSYVFLAAVGDSPPVVQDPDEQITDFRYVMPQDLRSVAAALRVLPWPWADWGRFRALPHDMVADALGS
jgi:8-oxo-dGTP pyrophosphatase MutT (NUDIX family)